MRITPWAWHDRFDQLQQAVKRSRFERARAGEPMPGHMRTRPRDPETEKLLIEVVKDAYRRTPPRMEHKDGKTTLVLPWLL